MAGLTALRTALRTVGSAITRGVTTAMRASAQSVRNAGNHLRTVLSRTRKTDNFKPMQRKPAPGHRPKPGEAGHYDVYFEMTLKPGDWARRRDLHSRRANEALDNAMRGDPKLRDALESRDPGVSQRVASEGGRKSPSTDIFTWNHAHPDVVGGRYGVMELVLKNQHTQGSRWWNIMHPGGRGGYYFWGAK